MGGPSAGGAPGRGSAGVYGTPTQYGSPSQYGANQPGQYGAPGQPGGGNGQFGAGTTQFGSPGQFGGGTTQYGGNQPGQYGSPGQYGADPAIARFGPGTSDEPDADGQPPRKSRRSLIIGLAVAGVVLVALAAVAIVVAMSGGSKNDYPLGSCVKQSGDKAASVACTDATAYSIVNKVDAPTKCADQTQPYVVLQRSGVADEVLCLKPAH
jgi:hypothetical protein